MLILNKDNYDNTQKYIFSIDGGGTSSKCLAGTATHKISFTSGSSNILVSSASVVKQHIEVLLRKSEYKLNIKRTNFRCMCIGSTGLGRKKELDIFSNILLELNITSPILLCSDAEISLFGTVGDYGAVLNVGTGTVAFAIDKDNTTHRVGGYGHILGDLGSGFWIGCEFVKEAIRLYEYNNENTLLNIVLEYFEVKNEQELISLIYTNFEKTKLASITNIVVDLSKKGNPTALSIFDRAIQEWRLLSKAIMKKSGQNSISYTGSILEKNHYLLSKFKQSFEGIVTNPIQQALEGAFYKALNYKP